MNEYYKIIKDGQFVDVAVFDELYTWDDMGLLNSSPKYCNILNHGELYHDPTWMRSIQGGLPYKEARVIQISEEEYSFLFNLVANGEKDLYDSKITEYKKIEKINEMNDICKQTIENGFDYVSGEDTMHFSLTIQDQMNINTLMMLSSQLDTIPYHADGEVCKFFAKDEFIAIAQKATEFTTYNITYNNSLKEYIKSLDSEDEINAVYYGIAIPDEFKSVVLSTYEN